MTPECSRTEQAEVLVLNDDQEALDRLAPKVVGELEDLRFWSK